MHNNKATKNKQRGIGLGPLVAVLFVVVIVAIMGLKIAPSYMEYFKIKSGVQAIAREKQNATPSDIRKQFESRATIDDISSVKATDLEITKEGNEVVISTAYRKEIPLFANVGVYIDFAATSRP
jgi:Tfp pilus assembly protein PilE